MKNALLMLILIFLLSFVAKSQDLITLRNGEEIFCKITRIDSSNIHYDFKKGERILSSFVTKNNVKSYRFFSDEDLAETINSNVDHTIVVDTSKYIKETSRWVNLITFSKRYGKNADGWSVQYYGYNFKNTSKWFIPIIFGIESFDIKPEYFSRSNYYSVDMNYIMAGISPFYKLNEFFFLNLGAQLIFGSEELQDFYSKESTSVIFGIAPSQGIYFIPDSKVGVTLGVSAYEKLLTSKVYKSDIGIKLEIGIKF